MTTSDWPPVTAHPDAAREPALTRRPAMARDQAVAGQPAVAGVLLDYGDTLITVERPEAALRAARLRAARRLSGGNGMPVEAASALLESISARLEAEVGAHAQSGELREIDLTAATDRAFTQAGHPLPAALLDELSREEQEAWWHGIRLTPGALPALGTLRERGLRIGLCSNAPYRPQSLRDQLAHLGLADVLDSVTFSGEVGWRKPSPQLFEAALSALGTTAASTVMVGDSALADIEGARRVGMRTVRLRQHRDDPRVEADAVIDRFTDLLGVLASWMPY